MTHRESGSKSEISAPIVDFREKIWKGEGNGYNRGKAYIQVSKHANI